MAADGDVARPRPARVNQDSMVAIPRVVRDDAYRAPAHAAVVWVLASVSNRTEVGDVTSLANPEIVEQIRGMVQADRPGDP